MFHVPGIDLTQYGGPEDRMFVVADACQPDFPIVYASQAFFTHTGYGPSETMGRNCRFLQGPDTSDETRNALRTALGEVRTITADILNYRKDGSTFWNRLRMKPITNDDGMLMYVIGIQNVIEASEVMPEPVFDRFCG